MTASEPEPTTSKPKRRWFRYSLHTLLTLSAILALSGIWLALRRSQTEPKIKNRTTDEVAPDVHDKYLNLQGLAHDSDLERIISRYCISTASQSVARAFRT